MDPIPFNRPDIGEAEISAAVRAIRSGWVTSGPEMRAFEQDFVEYAGGDVQAVAVNSATAGLHLVLEACGIGPGDEVIVPTWTFTSSAEVVRYLGATPVLVDVREATLLLDMDAVQSALTSHTRAVIPVHMAGLGVDIKRLRQVVGDHVLIIEDAAHALPTATGADLVGACDEADAAVFSFYATKTITTGEGGMVTTRHAEIAERIRVMRLHGIDRDAFSRYSTSSSGWMYDIVAPGYKYNLTDPAAAMGRVQLGRSAELHEKRSRIARRYLDDLRHLPIELPVAAAPPDVHAWHLFIIRLTEASPICRDGFIDAMRDLGIGTSVHFIPLHKMSYWRDSLGLQDADFPIASKVFPNVVSLPLYTSMTDAEVDRVVSATSGLLDS